MPYAIEPMQPGDVNQVAEIEKLVFTTPWPASAYKRELKNPQSTRYIVVRHYLTPPGPRPPINDQKGSLWLDWLPFFRKDEELEPPNPNPVVGYGGLWMMLDEAHITTIGVQPEHQGKKLGELLMVGLIDVAMQLGASWLTLEVRVSNTVAQNLYKKYTFKEAGLRRHYYTDNNEDAYIMWSDELTKLSFREKFQELKVRLFEYLAAQGELLPGANPDTPLLVPLDNEQPPVTPPETPGVKVERID